MQQTNTHYINGQCVSKQVFTNHINKVSRQRALKKALNTLRALRNLKAKPQMKTSRN